MDTSINQGTLCETCGATPCNYQTPEKCRSIITRAEQIVRNHQTHCDGDIDVYAPWCSCAPEGTPLCAGCVELRDLIVAAIASAQVEITQLRQEREQAMQVLDPFRVDDDLVMTCRQAYRMLPRRQPVMVKEFCICAAIVTEDGSIYRGHRHSDALMTAMHCGKTYRYTAASQGFITSTGRYVDRIEAARLQQAAGIKSVDTTRIEFPDELFSEDLY